jgi:hypothetical protein
VLAKEATFWATMPREDASFLLAGTRNAGTNWLHREEVVCPDTWLCTVREFVRGDDSKRRRKYVTKSSRKDFGTAGAA